MGGDGACGRRVAKFLLNVINKVFFVAGILLLVVGIIFMTSPGAAAWFFTKVGLNLTEVHSLLDGVIRSCGIYMIVIGCVVTAIAFFGMVGASCKSPCMLGTYAAIMILIILIEIGAIVFVVVFPKDFKKGMGEVVEKSLETGFKADYDAKGNHLQNNRFSNGSESAVWHAIQFRFECCGSSGYKDYKQFAWTQFNCTKADGCGYAVPLSCCKLRDGNGNNPDEFTDFRDPEKCLKSPSESTTNLDGCTEKIIHEAESFISSSLQVAIGVLAGIMLLEVILIAMAFVICCHTKDYSPSKYEKF